MSPGPVKTILFLDHTARLGGGEIALLDLTSALDRSRFEPVVVLAEDGPLAGRLRAAGVETHILPLAPAIVAIRKDALGMSSLLRLGTIFQLAGYAHQLARWARARGVSLIHANSLKADLYGGLAGRLARIPVLWHVRDHVDDRYLPPAVVRVFRGLAQSVPHAIIVNSESTLRQLQVRAAQPTAVVYSGLPAAHFAAVRAARNETPVLTMVGRLAPWKGQDVFLHAAARVLRRHPGARFRVVGAPLFGEDAFERELHRLADALNIGAQVDFLGFRDDVSGLLADTDIVVHASRLGEPFGQVVVQGMAAGRPVVATDGGAIPEIVLPGVTGLLVRPGDDEAMADALNALLADPALARRMGEAGRRRAQDHFTLERTASRVHAVYERLLAGDP